MMSVVALSHGYPPLWNLGGEVALHRMMTALEGDRVVLTTIPDGQTGYMFEGIRVGRIGTPNVLDLEANPRPIALQLEKVGARVVIVQNELSLPGVRAAKLCGIPSVVVVHSPPEFGHGVKDAVRRADHVVFNTHAAAEAWGMPGALVIHPPAGPLPPQPAGPPTGDAYTLLSSLRHKGVEVMLELAALLPGHRFLIVESPAVAMEPRNLRDRIRALPNVELRPRVEPGLVASEYLSQTRILFVPSRYETYGMSAIEAAGWGIPSVHVDTPHVREGIGRAAGLVPPLDALAANKARHLIEQNYADASEDARERAEAVARRQDIELARWAEFIAKLV